jgi:glutamate/tyrosine decarboxylase-like PLP-dependent enzyme
MVDAPLSLDASERARLLERVAQAIEAHREKIPEGRLEPAAEVVVHARELAESFDFSTPLSPDAALDRVLRGLETMQVHTTHPGYFGLFNPSPAFMGVIADTLVAAFNPQLATHSHASFPVEAERHLVRAFGKKLGFSDCDGTFASGGAEANHTALLLALTRAHPNFGTDGVRALPAQPTIYVGTETHDSIAKAARLSGLGTAAVRVVPTDDKLRIDPRTLREHVVADRDRGLSPLAVVATCGTTGAGVIDPMDAIADVASDEGLWMHVDAAWGGAAALVPELRGSIAGIARADSVTLDAHKWLSVPMGAGMLLTPHAHLLDRTFAIDATYMPTQREDAPDPYLRSMQWSRRFIGLKLLLSLAVAGWDGYAEVLRHQVAMADVLRRKLAERGWRVVNDTPLPLVCFVDGTREDGETIRYLAKAMNVVVATRHSWISVARLGAARRPALRACITNTATTEVDLERLLDALERARQKIAVRE